MYFTKEDYNKIAEWLKANAMKDSDFTSKDSIDSDNTIVVVADGENYKIEIEKLFNSALMGLIIDAIKVKSIVINESLIVSPEDVTLNDSTFPTLKEALDKLKKL